MRKNRNAAGLPLLLFQMTMNSAEIIARRWQMAASGRMSPAEYSRMVLEKIKATQQTSAAMLSGNPSVTKLLWPWHVGSRRNVKRLRKRH